MCKLSISKIHKYILLSGLTVCCTVPQSDVSDTRWELLIFDWRPVSFPHRWTFQMPPKQPKLFSRSRLCTKRRTTRWRTPCWTASVSDVSLFDIFGPFLNLCFWFGFSPFRCPFINHLLMIKKITFLEPVRLCSSRTRIFNGFSLLTHSWHCSFVADALLRKAFATPSFQGYNFVSSLLVLLGLIKVRFSRARLTQVRRPASASTPVADVPSRLAPSRARTRWSPCPWFPVTCRRWSTWCDKTTSPRRTWPRCRLSCRGKDVNRPGAVSDSQVQNTQPVSVSPQKWSSHNCCSWCTARWLHAGGGSGFCSVWQLEGPECD